VATEVGIVPEVINTSNGIIVPPGNEAALEAAVDRMLDISGQFDRKIIQEGIFGKFTGETVGKQIFSVYQRLLKITQ
jgi:glycosyltransferase involved in cell wall biosynthesis